MNMRCLSLLIVLVVSSFFLNAQDDTLQLKLKNLNSYNLKFNVNFSYGFGRKSFDWEGMDIANAQMLEDLSKSRPWMLEARAEIYKGINLAFFRGESKMSGESSSLAWYIDENSYFWLRKYRWRIVRQGVAIIYEFRPKKNSLLTLEAGFAYAFSKLYNTVTLEGTEGEFDLKYKSNDVKDFALNFGFRFPLFRNLTLGAKYVQYFGNYDYLNGVGETYGFYFEKTEDDPHGYFSLKESCFMVTLNYDLFLKQSLF